MTHALLVPGDRAYEPPPVYKLSQSFSYYSLPLSFCPVVDPEQVPSLRSVGGASGRVGGGGWYCEARGPLVAEVVGTRSIWQAPIIDGTLALAHVPPTHWGTSWRDIEITQEIIKTLVTNRREIPADPSRPSSPPRSRKLNVDNCLELFFTWSLVRLYSS